MPRGLPRNAGALLVAALALSALAVFFGGGSAYAPLVKVGALAVVLSGVAVALALLGVLPFPRLDRAGAAFLTLMGVFVLWNGLSIMWSVIPDRSWEYFNRSLVYIAFALLGVLVAAAVPRAQRAVALGFLGVFAAAIGWALLGKAIPELGPDAVRTARLRAPIDYWNALALVAAMTMPLALWAAARKEHARILRVGSVVVLYAATVALMLTYSRGGVVVALVVLVAYLVLSRELVAGAGALLVALPPAVVLCAWAFTQPGIVDAGELDRRADGLQFGAALLLGGVLVAAFAYLGVRHEERWRSRLTVNVSGRRLALVSGAALLVAVLAVSRGDPVGWARDGFSEFTNPVSEAGAGPERLGDFSSNSRWTWWEEAWQLWEENAVAGTGAGSFSVARRPLRTNTTVATEPHNLALQLLSETGLVGVLLGAGAGIAAAVGIVLALRRLEEEEWAAAVALAALVLAYLAHALIDYDWDFVAVTGPVFLVLGVLVAAGQPALVRARREWLFAAGGLLLSLAVVASLAAPWLASREVAEAYEALERRSPTQAGNAARRARALNPFSVEPLFAEALAEEAGMNDAAALDLYIRAVELQPKNPRTWFELGRFELDVGLRDAAIRHLQRSSELDQWGPADPVLGQLGL